MKNLRDILYKTGMLEVIGQTDLAVGGVVSDSKQVKPGDVFVAIKGMQTDGHRFIPQAIQAGARAVVCEEMPGNRPEGVTFVRVKDTRSGAGIMAANFYDHPSEKLKLVGITGTNGKTSTATLLYDLFSAMGHPCGLLSTIRIMIAGKAFDTTHTTPDPIRLNQVLHNMVQAGCDHVFMEVSSHAVVQKRIEGVKFAGGVFTNITHDHLDYHASFRDYLQAKKSFFDGLGKEAFALINKDDKNGPVMLQNTKARAVTYGLTSAADYQGRLMESTFSGMHMQIDRSDLWTKLVGRFNALNLLAVYATARLLGAEKEEVLRRLSLCSAPEGRFDHFTANNHITVIIDYAHTPDALDNVLRTIGEIRTRQETLYTVVGCGGNRDKAKRPLMAAIAASHSDKVILTSDNPRMEDPDTIIEDMKTGLDILARKKTLSITNRKEAIHAACQLAKTGDIILIAGKGHEKVQEIQGVRHTFDDKQIAMEALQ